ncbi:ribonuclease HI family protein [bacterium]|nr:ribonuclease HI family protein [bacterium]
MKLILYTDGGARGNPGPAAIGVIVYDSKKNVIKKISKYIGRATNNQAEYQALITGLIEAKKIKAEDVECFSDSKLVVQQVNRKYKIKNKKLAQLFIKIWNLSQSFKKIKFSYIPREKNREADRLVNLALDKYLSKNSNLLL